MSQQPASSNQSLAILNELELKMNVFFQNCMIFVAAHQQAQPQQQSQQPQQQTYTFKQAKHDAEQINVLLQKLEQSLDQTQTIFVVDHNKNYLTRQEVVEKSNKSFAEQFSNMIKDHVSEQTAQDKRSLATMSQSTLLAMDQLKRLNDPLFLDLIQEQESHLSQYMYQHHQQSSSRGSGVNE